MVITIRDEVLPGGQVGDVVVEVPTRLTARDLIRLRVREGVARYNARPAGRVRGLVRPTDAEDALNGYRMSPGSRIDWEQQADAAVAAFERNGFTIFVGDRQVEDLDERLCLDDTSDVSFVRLVPLVGG